MNGPDGRIEWPRRPARSNDGQKPAGAGRPGRRIERARRQRAGLYFIYASYVVNSYIGSGSIDPAAARGLAALRRCTNFDPA